MDFEVAVVGAGHAGCEAALAAARLGLSTVLYTLRVDGVAWMSCNPAIGGLGKSQIVRELDALGGEMGHAADATAIHYRRLNASKGPAVRARRVQNDLPLYHRVMLRTLQAQEHLVLQEGRVIGLDVGRAGIAGVVLEDGTVCRARAVVVTTGTFLNGLIYVGMESFPGGRLGDPTPRGLSESLAAHGLTIGRLKTGTPARLLARSIDLSGLQAQPPDPIQHPFSHEGPGFVLPQVRCYGARTNPKTHEIIRQALDRSPLYCGVIKGRGPRYCPSIEDKVVRFPDRQSHTVVLEPMDSTQEVLYPNGISTSLPRDVQDRFIHSIEGLERAEVLHHGYAIEYDFVLPTQLKPSLEVKKVPGLFLAGQINGTSGYEEAAGQGLIAGINAAATVRRRAPVTLGRHEAYLGVLIDDLVTRGTEEPYRMFSSRVEYRLLLREDNAATRMQSWAKAVGLVPPEVLARREEQQRQLQRLVALLRDTRVAPEADGHRPSLQEMLRRPEVTIRDLERHLPEEASIDVLEQAEVQIKYQGYIEREVQQVERLKKSESQRIPEDMPYETISGLTRELSEKLMKIRPETLGQAGRIDGMTPAALMLLSIWINKQLRVPRGTKVGKD